MNDIVNDKKGYSIVSNSFAHKPDGLLFIVCVGSEVWHSDTPPFSSIHKSLHNSFVSATGVVQYII